MANQPKAKRSAMYVYFNPLEQVGTWKSLATETRSGGDTLRVLTPVRPIAPIDLVALTTRA